MFCQWKRLSILMNKTIQNILYFALRADKICVRILSTPSGLAGKKIVLFPLLSAKLFNVSRYWLVKRIDMICSSFNSTFAPFNSFVVGQYQPREGDLFQLLLLRLLQF